MKIHEILPLELTDCEVDGSSKKRVLEHLSHLMADQLPVLEADRLYQSFLYRERLGSTGIGEGVAIPHCRLSGCDKIRGALLKLTEPVDFDAIDNTPVDLVFGLVVPEDEQEEHLAVLAAIAGLLQDPDRRRQLRQANSNQALHDLATAAVAS